MQRPRLPRLHCFDRGIGLRENRQGRCFGAMHFILLALDFAHRHAARVARRNLVGESGPAGWVFEDQLRFKGALAIARDFDRQFALSRLLAFAFAVAGAADRVEYGRVPVMALGFGELLEQLVSLPGLRVSQRPLPQPRSRMWPLSWDSDRQRVPMRASGSGEGYAGRGC